MAEYQNIFNQVQVAGPLEAGEVEGVNPEFRFGKPRHNFLIGWLGNAQLGPIYLGFWGVLSLVAGAIWFFIIGMNFWAQVDYSPALFFRELLWLSLDPPTSDYGLGMAPLDDGGWWVIASFFLLVSVMSWWARCYVRAQELKMGKHVAWAFAAAACA